MVVVASLTRARLIKFTATAASAAAAAGALIVGGDIEVTLLMVAAVVAGLVCFDVSMERRVQTFVPWALLSLAPVTKTIPTVWLQLRSDDSGALPERYDHLGSLLFGLCMFAAVVALSRPAPVLGARTAVFDAAVIIGSAFIAALAGASVAFLVDTNFGSATAGRLLETPTWFVVGGLLAGVALAASRTEELSAALAWVLLIGAATAGLLAYSVAGGTFDVGVWALLFAALTISAAATTGDLGRRSARTRQSSIGVVIAIVVGAVAAAAAISARSDRTSWEPGWGLLGIASLAMFGLAMAKKPAENQGATRVNSRVDGRGNELGMDDAERLARAHRRALRSLGSTSYTEVPDTAPQSAGVEAAPAPLSPAVAPVEPHAGMAAADAAPNAEQSRVLPAPTEPIEVAPAPPQRIESTPEPAPAQRIESAPTDPIESRPAPAPAQRVESAPAPAPAEPSPAQLSTAVPDPVAANPEPAATQPPLSDASLVSSVQAAAAVRTAPAQQRHTLAPLPQAHHFDPSTGLLSAAGLQHALARAFDVPRQAGHVTLMVFMIRDLDEIERNHGRLASAAVTRQVADRVSSLLPHGTGARFGRAAYAVVFVGDLSNSSETVQALARVLLQLRAPVEGGSLGDKIDVVGGMAQCYEGEDAAQFVSRANQGLARAVQSPEPTFVAMP